MTELGLTIAKYETGRPLILLPKQAKRYYTNSFFADRSTMRSVICFGRGYHSRKPVHCLTGPALQLRDGTKFWCQNGIAHREDGPAKVYAFGEWTYYRHGLVHRDDGPAHCNARGHEFFYQNGKLHREAAPAMVGKWFVHGRDITIPVKEWVDENDFPPWQEWTPDIQAMWRLWFCGC